MMPIRVEKLRSVLTQLEQYQDGEVIQTHANVKNLIDGADDHLQVREARQFIEGLIAAAGNEKLSKREYKRYLKGVERKLQLDEPRATKNFNNFKNHLSTLGSSLQTTAAQAIKAAVPDGDMTKVIKAAFPYTLSYEGDAEKLTGAAKLMLELGYVAVERGAFRHGEEREDAEARYWGVLPASFYAEHYGEGHKHLGDQYRRGQWVFHPGGPNSAVIEEMFGYLEALGFSYDSNTQSWLGAKEGKSADERMAFLNSAAGALAQVGDDTIALHVVAEVASHSKGDEGELSTEIVNNKVQEARLEAKDFLEKYTTGTRLLTRALPESDVQWRDDISQLSRAAKHCVWFTLEQDSRDAWQAWVYLRTFTKVSPDSDGKRAIQKAQSEKAARCFFEESDTLQRLIAQELDRTSIKFLQKKAVEDLYDRPIFFFHPNHTMPIGVR